MPVLNWWSRAFPLSPPYSETGLKTRATPVGVMRADRKSSSSLGHVVAVDSFGPSALCMAESLAVANEI